MISSVKANRVVVVFTFEEATSLMRVVDRFCRFYASKVYRKERHVSRKLEQHLAQGSMDIVQKLREQGAAKRSPRQVNKSRLYRK